jgi:hypothetical protein
MSGILSILREVLAIFYPNQVPQRSIFWNCVIIAFIISAIILWIIEHRKAIKLSSKLEKELDHSKPKLSAEIGFTSIAPAGEKNENLLVIITAIIKNTGAPSIVSDFQLLIKVDGKETVGQFFPLSEGKITLQSIDGQVILLKSDDNLIIKSGSQPILTGGAVNGFCAVLVPNVIHEDISSKGILVLGFKDVFGNDYNVEHNMSGGKPIKFIDPSKIQKRD